MGLSSARNCTYIFGSLELTSFVLLLAVFLYLALFFRKICFNIKWALGSGLFIGGALSNIFERIFTGCVFDYFRISFVSFNLADLLIVFSLVFLLLYEYDLNNSKKDSAS